MPSLGAPELIIIALVVLLLFGATRLPKLGKSLGQSISGFKKGLNEDPGEEIVEIAPHEGNVGEAKGGVEA